MAVKSLGVMQKEKNEIVPKVISQLSNRNLSLWISAIYVGIGALYFSFSNNSAITDGIMYFIFLPATSIASFLNFVGGGILSFIIGESFAMALVFLVVYGFVASMRNDPKSLDNPKEEKSTNK